MLISSIWNVVIGKRAWTGEIKIYSIEDDGRVIINNQYNLENCMIYLKDFYDMNKLDLLAFHQRCMKYGSIWILTEESKIGLLKITMLILIYRLQ